MKIGDRVEIIRWQEPGVAGRTGSVTRIDDDGRIYMQSDDGGGIYTAPPDRFVIIRSLVENWNEHRLDGTA